MPLDQAGKAEKKEFKPVAPGSYTSAAIILLTDGQRTTGPDSIEAARMAADRGVRIFTVGFGTKSGETIGFEGWSMRVRLDEETLKTIASMTRGEYFYAGTATDLKKVYESLNSNFCWKRRIWKSARYSPPQRQSRRWFPRCFLYCGSIGFYNRTFLPAK